MENTSKALIMAATVLLGVMIMSVGVVLFNSFSGFSSDITSEIERTKIAEFNNKFLKYYGETTEYNSETNKYEVQKIKLTSHDVVTLANLAKKNNIEYEVEGQTGKSQNSYYIQISLTGTQKYKNFEKLDEAVLTEFLQNNNMIYNSNSELVTKYFYVVKVEVNEHTGRVIYVEISELK